MDIPEQVVKKLNEKAEASRAKNVILTIGEAGIDEKLFNYVSDGSQWRITFSGSVMTDSSCYCGDTIEDLESIVMVGVRDFLQQLIENGEHVGISHPNE